MVRSPSAVGPPFPRTKEQRCRKLCGDSSCSVTNVDNRAKGADVAEDGDQTNEAGTRRSIEFVLVLVLRVQNGRFTPSKNFLAGSFQYAISPLEHTLDLYGREIFPDSIGDLVGIKLGDRFEE